MRRILPVAALASTLLTLSRPASAQNVGINADGTAPAAAAMLDVDVTALPANAKKGMLVPRVALTNATSNAPIGAGVVNSLLVFNTFTSAAPSNISVSPGYYYWSTDITPNRWVRVATDRAGWGTTGNYGIDNAVNYIGTNDAASFIIKTGAGANHAERMRIHGSSVGTLTGRIVVNHVQGLQTDIFSSYGSNTVSGGVANTTNYAGATRSMAAYTTTGFGVFGNTNGTVNTSAAIYAQASQTTGAAFALRAEASSGHGRAIMAYGNFGGGAIPAANPGLGVAIDAELQGTLAGTARGIAVRGITVSAMNDGDAYGVWGQTTSRMGTGVFGVNNYATATANIQPTGVWGQVGNVRGIGTVGFNTVVTNTAGTAPTGVHGQASSPRGIGVVGIVGTNNTVGAGVRGINQGTTGAANTWPDGVYGTASGTLGAGVFGDHAHVGGTGVAGMNGTDYFLPAGGAGGAFTGLDRGAVGYTMNATGTGLIGLGNNINSTATLPGGAGVSGRGTTTGVVGFGTTAADGVGVVGAGNGINNPALPADGAGGAFTGSFNGVFARTTNAAGHGIQVAGNNLAPIGVAAGAGGSLRGTAVGGLGQGTVTINGVGLIGLGNGLVTYNTPALGAGVAGTGSTVGTAGFGVEAATGVGLVGAGNGITALAMPGTGAGGYMHGDQVGTVTHANNATGHGLLAAGNNLAPLAMPDGAGGSLRGTLFGAVGSASVAADGIGVVGLGNGIVAVSNVPASGAGVAGIGQSYGVYGYAFSNADGEEDAPVRAGGYFRSGSGAAATEAWVATWEGPGIANNRKVVGDGTVNTIVRHADGHEVLLSAPEAPENLFQDYGTGQLVNGRATITLDPTLSNNIVVDAAHPLRVFVQLRGDCNGVFVRNESGTGFDVVELMGGTSNAEFYWTVTANRANVDKGNGVVWTYAEERFPRFVRPSSVSRGELTEAPVQQQAVSVQGPLHEAPVNEVPASEPQPAILREARENAPIELLQPKTPAEIQEAPPGVDLEEENRRAAEPVEEPRP